MKAQISPPLFADVLLGAMMDADVNCSELARRVWGTIKDRRGYHVARNRDRVGHYLRGSSYPNPTNLRKIANALGIQRATLAAARRSVMLSPTRLAPPPRPEAKQLPITIKGHLTITLYP